MATVGVLCARVRVEEKQLMAALAEAGVVPTPLPPANVPLPLPPVPPASAAPPAARVIVDRCQDRAAAAAILTACRALGAVTLDAGIAAVGDRLAVATTLAMAGLPRPETRLTCSPAAALEALDELGYPGTLLPLTAGTAPVTLLDADVAEAVLEHRAVLGAPREALALVQAGAPAVTARTTIVVVDGRAVATIGEATPVPPPAAALAERAADALGALVAGVEVAWGAGGPVAWDVLPIPEYRRAVPLGAESVAAAIAAAVVDRLGLAPSIGGQPTRQRVAGVQIEFEDPRRSREGREVRDGVVLSA